MRYFLRNNLVNNKNVWSATKKWRHESLSLSNHWDGECKSFKLIYWFQVSYRLCLIKQLLLKLVSNLPKNCFVYVNKSLLKKKKNAFCFIWKVVFFLKVFKFLSWILGHAEKAVWFKISWRYNNISMEI